MNPAFVKVIFKFCITKNCFLIFNVFLCKISLSFGLLEIIVDCLILRFFQFCQQSLECFSNFLLVWCWDTSSVKHKMTILIMLLATLIRNTSLDTVDGRSSRQELDVLLLMHQVRILSN